MKQQKNDNRSYNDIKKEVTNEYETKIKENSIDIPNLIINKEDIIEQETKNRLNKKSENYSTLKSLVLCFDMEINFAYVGAVTIEGVRVYISVFKNDKKSYAIFSNINGDKTLFYNDLENISVLEKQIYVSKMLLKDCDNLIVNPSAWINIDESNKNKIKENTKFHGSQFDKSLNLFTLLK